MFSRNEKADSGKNGPTVANNHAGGPDAQCAAQTLAAAQPGVARPSDAGGAYGPATGSGALAQAGHSQLAQAQRQRHNRHSVACLGGRGASGPRQARGSGADGPRA